MRYAVPFALASIGVFFTVTLLAQAQPSKDALPKHALMRIGDSRFHGGGHRMRFTPDGNALLVADNEKIRLIDAAMGDERLLLRHLSKSIAKSVNETPQDVIEMAFLSGGKSLASADLTGVLRVWSLADGKETRLPEPHPGVATLCVAGDERSLFTAGFDGVLNEWLLPGGKKKQSWTAPGNEPILAIARLGNLVAAVTKSGTLVHWDPATGKQVKQFDLGPVLLGIPGTDFGARKFPAKGSTSPSFAVYPRNIEFSPDGKRLAQIQGRQIWDAENGKVLANLAPSKAAVRFAFSHDNKHVVSAPTGLKDMMRWCDCASGTEMKQIDVGKIESLAVSPDGQTVAFSASNRIRLWRHAKNQLAGGGDAIGAIKDIDVSQDGTRFAVSTRDKVVRIYDLKSGKHEDTFSTEDRAADLVRFHPDGKTMIAAIYPFGILHYQKQAAGWRSVQRFDTKEQLKELHGNGPFAPFGNTQTDLINLQDGTRQAGLARQGKYAHFTYSPDGRHMLAAGEVPVKPGMPPFKTSKVYQLFDVQAMKVVRAIKAPARGFPEARFSPDGRLIVLDSDPPQVIELLSGAERATIPLKFPRGAVDFAPDGRSLLVGTRDGALVVVGMAKGQELYRTEPAHTGNVTRLRSISGGKIISVAADHTVVVWSPTLWKDRVPVGKLKLDPEDLDLFYEALDKSEGANIGAAITTLIGGGDITVRFLKTKITPAKQGDSEKPGDPPSPARLRAHRAIEILEHIGTPAAREALEALSRGHPSSSTTAEAKDSLSRFTLP